ncbi:MAG: hypothetical protein ACTSR2_03460 [Candidatus Hodarchaeales archaeon]
MLESAMVVDKNKVNSILKEIQEILKKYKPNASELQIINQKISQMTARNIQKQMIHDRTAFGGEKAKILNEKPKKEWRKIKIE